MAKSYLGIDVGSNTLKIAELERVGNSVVLKNYHVESLRDVALLEADGTKERVILQKIERFLKDKKIKTDKVNIAVSSQSVFTRLVKLPAVDKNKLEQIVKYEAQQQIPFPIDEVVWSYQLLDAVDGSDDISALLVAVKSEVAYNTFSFYESKKFLIDIIDISPLALANSIAFAGEIDKEISNAIINLDAFTTNIIIIENGLIWTRMIPLGGMHLTESIAGALNISIDEAERLKCAFKGESDDEASVVINGCVDKYVTKLIAEIVRSIGFYRTQFLGSNINKFMLSGGAVALESFQYKIKEKYNDATIEIVDIFNKVEVKESILKDDDFIMHKSLLNQAVGLALRGVADCSLEINLVPEALKRKRFFATQEKYVFMSGILITTLMISLVFYFMQITAIDKESLSTMKDIIEEVRVLEEQKKTLEKDFMIVDRKHTVVNEYMRMRSFWLDLLLEIESIIPKNTWLTDVYPDYEKEQRESKKTAARSARKARGSRGRAISRAIVGKGKEDQDGEPESFNEISIVYIEGRTTGIYKDLIQFRDALKKSLYIKDEDGGADIVSARILDSGEREFVMSMKLETPIIKKMQQMFEEKEDATKTKKKKVR